MNESRGITLRPFVRGDLSLILSIFADLERSYLWGHRRVCDEEQILETWRVWSHERMAAKFTVVRGGRPIGLVFDYERSVEDGHTKVATLLLPEETGRGAGVIATTLFCQWLFQQVPLRKVYLDVFEFNAPVARMLKKLGAGVEMHRRQHRFWNGRYWDQYEFSFFREDLPELSRRILRCRERPQSTVRVASPPARQVVVRREAGGVRSPETSSASYPQINDQALVSLLHG